MKCCHKKLYHLVKRYIFSKTQLNGHVFTTRHHLIRHVFSERYIFYKAQLIGHVFTIRHIYFENFPTGSLNNPMLNSDKGKNPTLTFGTVNDAIIIDVSLHYKQ